MSIVSAPPVSPYRGLAAFDDTELDALFFFGRERERDVLVANLLAARFTVLYGESGVGKSSLLAAAVVRDLRAAVPGVPVVMHASWSGSVDVLDELAGADEGYLILDQFEEYFLYHADEDGPGALLHDLPELLHDTHVNVLVALREDALARLDAFKARIPSIFANQIRLEHLDRREATSAILGPLERWRELTDEPVQAESDFVEAVLDDTRTPGGDRIEAPYLQLVLERIWEAEREAGSDVLRVETLRRLGGAATIVRDHLHIALASLEPDEQEVAASMFEHLVTPSGTKIAHRAPDLAEYAHVPEPTLRQVLGRLSGDRIVHSVEGSDRYEIFHDVLAEPISAWRLQRRLEQERATARRRQRRLVGVAIAALIALAVVTGLAVWAFAERGTARSQARQARAGEFEAQSLQQLQLDPNRSLRLALEAARLEPDRVATSVLRQALISDRLRLSAHAHAPIAAVAFSTDGKLLAVAAGRRTVRLLSGANRRLVRTFHTTGPVSELSFSPGGSRLVAVGATGKGDVLALRTGSVLEGGVTAARLPDGALKVVSLRGGLRAAAEHIRHLVVSPDGRELAAAIGYADGHVRASIFTRGGALIRTLPYPGIRDLSFSPDGRLLATAAANGDTLLWHASTGRWVRSLREAKDGANTLAFSPDGALLATGGRDFSVRIFKVATGDRLFFLLQHKNPVATVMWSPDGRVVASGSYDHTAVLWRVQRLTAVGSEAALLAGSKAPVTSIGFSPDSSRLVTGGADGTARVWDARPDAELALLARRRGSALAARWAGDTIVALWSSGAVETFSASTHARLRVWQVRSKAEATALGVATNGAVVAVGDAGGGTTAWDARTGRRLWRHEDGKSIEVVTVSPDGAFVAAANAAGRIRLRRERDGALLWSATTRGQVRALAFSPNGENLLAAGDGGVVVRSARDGRDARTLQPRAGATSATYSADGKLIAAAGADGKLRLWFAGTGNLYRSLPAGTHTLTGVSFSVDAARVATSGEDADAHVWGVPRGTGQVLQRAAGGPLRAVNLDATGEWVVAAAPTSAIVWSASSGNLLAYLRGNTSLVTSASFAPTSSTVLTSSRDGTVRTYACEVCADLPALVHLTEHRLAQTG